MMASSGNTKQSYRNSKKSLCREIHKKFNNFHSNCLNSQTKKKLGEIRILPKKRFY